MKLLATALFLSAAGIAQPQFEVASVKPAAPGGRGIFVRVNPGGRLTVNNMSLKDMIVFAYRIQPFQISGGPSWMDSTRFDVEAKPDHSPKPDELPQMMQALLADRFQLVIRRETKDLPIYALVLARKDGKLGPKMVEPTKDSCVEFDPLKGPPLAPDPNRRMCGGSRMGMNQYSGTSVQLDFFIHALSRTLQRPVENRTGLTGKYDITLEWTPDETQLAGLPPDVPKPNFDPAGPAIFTAIQEQLGLKLESAKGPVEVFVIERAEKPTEN
jgi:uncharacterized protein (TIGR03435 family)